MLDGIFEINSYEIEDVQGNMNNADTELTGANDEAKQNFVSFKQSGVFSKGIKKIHNQMDSISGSLKLMNKAIQRGTESAFTQEAALASEIGILEIPKDFAVNNDLTQKSFDNLSLKKKDGISVNNGTASKQIELANLSAISQKADLYDQTNELGQEVEADDSKLNSSNIKLFSLSDIGKGDTQEVSDELKYDQTESVNLQDMGNSDGTSVKPEIASNTNGQSLTIKNITKKSQSSFEVTPSFGNMGSSNLGSMNIGGQNLSKTPSISSSGESIIEIEKRSNDVQSYVEGSSINAQVLETSKEDESQDEGSLEK